MTTTIPTPLHHGHHSRHLIGAGFEVALHEGASRAARVVPGATRVCVVVADASVATAGSPVAFDLPVNGASASCLVWCHSGGAIQVRASWAPPALLISREQTVMVPETPGTPGLSMMALGDRLLVLSSSAFEAAPERMVRLLHARPEHLLAVSPDEILHDVFLDVPDAGGAVITRLS